MTKKKSNRSQSANSRPSSSAPSSKQRATSSTQGEVGSYAQAAAVPPSSDKADIVVKQEMDPKLQEEERLAQQKPTSDPDAETNTSSFNNDEKANKPVHTSSSLNTQEDDKRMSTDTKSKEEAQTSHPEGQAPSESWESEASNGLEPSPPPNKSELPVVFEASPHEASVDHGSKRSHSHSGASLASSQCPRYSPTSTVSQHVGFFDRNQTGIITPADTFCGFRELGFGLLLSFFAAVFIHGAFSMPSWGWRWDWKMRCRVEGMSLCKHGSDSGVYNVAGNMDEAKFAQMWKNWSKDGETMDKKEMWAMIANHRVVFDPFGWTAAMAEWWVTYLLLWPQDGKIRKDEVKKMYTGELFWEMAEKRKGVKSGKKHKKNA